MSASVSSLNPGSLYWQIMAMLKAEQRHGPLLQVEYRDEMLQSHSARQPVTRLIMSLVSLKQVASRVKGAEAVVKEMNAALTSTIDGVFSMPGDDATNSVPPWWGLRPGPNPYLVAAELTQYSNVLTDEAARIEYGAVIDIFAAKLSAPR